MNAKGLLAHYERVADAPDAIARLRRFVLNLAVRGKLVPQDAMEEAASELLKRFDPTALRSGSSREQHETTSRIEGSLAAVVPRGWCAVTGSDLFPTRSGNSKLIKGQLHAQVAPDRYPGFSAAGQDVWLDGWEHEGQAIILSAVGARCGKAFLATGKWSAVANTHIVWLPPDIILAEYAMLQLNDENFWIRSGGAQPFLKVKETLRRAFLVPPFAEQHRIVGKVDELMGLCDRLEAARTEREAARDRLAAASLARLGAPVSDRFEDDARFALGALPALTTRPDQIKPLRQTILNLAVRGMLVPQDLNDEPASELLKRIAREKARLVKEGKSRRQDALPEIDLDQAPFDLPHGWAWGRFPELGSFGRGKSKHRPRNDAALFNGGTHPMIQTGDVARSQGVIQSYTSKYNEIGLSQSFKWPRGTLCVTIAANIADSGILSFDACFPDSVVGFVPASMFEGARYFEYFVRTAKANLLAFAPATAQKNINLEILTQVLVPLPPLAEQHRIVARVDELMALCDRLETNLVAANASRAHLLDALLHDALNGSALAEAA